jgi:hypothetical protein
MGVGNVFRRLIILVPAVILLLGLAFGTFYTYWNSASPEKTCASCHEIVNPVNMLGQSSHRNFLCKECHGTALSNGLHSLTEKGMMVVNHVRNKKVEDIRMNENQLLEVMNNCRRCHSSEYASWLSGGHSARYRDIFLNKKHNSGEQMAGDCLRCHGMFYDASIRDLVEPLDIKGPWSLTDSSMADKPVIPCLACHQVHRTGETACSPDYSDPHSAFYNRQKEAVNAGFYDRHEKVHIGAGELPQLTITSAGRMVKVSQDPAMRVCVQCHAPAAKHEAGTSDDRTPVGVHEGLSCLACHETHSNDARGSCINCHPAISNCKLDVTTMNTSFANPESPNNIHWVACTSCHKKGRPVPGSSRSF